MENNKLKLTAYIEIDGENFLWDDIPKDKQKEISQESNIRGMKAIGMTPVDKKSNQ